MGALDDTDANLRRSTFDTLAFLASPAQQREFAAKVHYDDYVEEFSCWWFDSFLPDNPLSMERYSQAEFAVLRDFSENFDRHVKALGFQPRSIQDLLADPTWVNIVADAIAAMASIPAHA